MTLRLRLLVALIPLFVLGLVAADVGTYSALQSYLTARLDQQLLSAHQLVLFALAGDTHPEGPRRGPGGGGPVVLPAGTYGELRTPAGAPLTPPRTVLIGFGTGAAHPVLPATLTPGSRRSPRLLTVEGTGGVDHYRVYVDTADDGSGNVLVTALPLSEVFSTLTRLLLLELGISAAVTLVLAAVIWSIVRRSLVPLERMGETARSVAASGLGQRVSPATERTEVGRLGLALNSMLSQLEAAFSARAASEERLRHFVSDASHELRTPLTSMRGYAELFRRTPDMSRADVLTAMQRIEQEAQRMGVLVDELLLLARLDQGRPLEREPVELDALIADACADARATEPGRQITEQVERPVVVIGDEGRLRQVVANLVRNALVHTPADTAVEITLEARGGTAVLRVIDHGPGIPRGQAERIFERFHRADPARSRDQGGSGLGLGIVAAVVESHGGVVSVAETPGGGSTFRVELPLAEKIAAA